jgi:hypothetical protein
MNSPKDRISKSWPITIGRGQHKSRGIKLTMWVAEINGKPIEVNITGCPGNVGIILEDFCKVISICMRHNVPMGQFLKTFRGRMDEIRGPVTGDEFIEECSSIPDYIARALAVRYPELITDLAHDQDSPEHMQTCPGCITEFKPRSSKDLFCKTCRTNGRAPAPHNE